MEDLIKALSIFIKYSQEKYPTHCEHDVMYVRISPKNVSEEDCKDLESLGFIADLDEDCFYSFHFGSC